MLAALAAAMPRAEVVLTHAGSIRVDDILPPPLTQYDIVPSLPFGGSLQEVEIQGRLLTKVLEQGRKMPVAAGIWFTTMPLPTTRPTNAWKLKNIVISPAKTYRVAMNDFLLTVKEVNLDYSNPTHPDMARVFKTKTARPNPQSDVRLAIVRYLEKKP